MRKVILIALTAVISMTIGAQNIQEELKADHNKAGSNYCIYLGPSASVKDTPAPKGKKPFYISHYGRHGSRYLIHQREYDYPYATLMAADRDGKLSEQGKTVFEHVKLLREEAHNRLGELTPLGAEQHRDIAKRMFKRFPQVFKGNVTIDAKSTVVIRCIISMSNFLGQLAVLNPKLQFKSDASEYDMYYMNLQDRKLYNQKWNDKATDAYEAFCRKHARHEKPMLRLFNDSTYAWDNINLYRLNLALFKLGSSVPGTEVGRHFSLFNELYTDDELYHDWLQTNAFWYISYGSSPLNGGLQPFTQRKLLRKIISEADSCIALPRPGATLRFGHETIVLPLTCLIGINGFDQQIENLDELENRGWVNYKVFPMAANVQFIFYRKNPADQDVLIKVLLNENEATLPIPTDCVPYYHWKDFREFYLKKLDSYQE